MVKSFQATPSQLETIKTLQNKLPTNNHKLYGFAAEPITGSRNMLILRKVGEQPDDAIVESMCVGPRGKIQATAVLFVK